MFLHAIVLKSKAMLFVDNYEKCGEQHNFEGGGRYDYRTNLWPLLQSSTEDFIKKKFRTYRIHL